MKTKSATLTILSIGILIGILLTRHGFDPAGLVPAARAAEEFSNNAFDCPWFVPRQIVSFRPGRSPEQGLGRGLRVAHVSRNPDVLPNARRSKAKV